ncbi:MAG: single-stranded-DNA-specific exonuclease RecJ, partial [Myxococcota bacterium]
MNASSQKYRRRWVVRASDPAGWEQIARQLDIHPVVARLLVHRGYDEPDAAHRFLNPSLGHMHDPFSMKGMDDAVHELLRALDTGSRIVIHGDYDVDGICSASLLYSFLEMLGADVDYFIPRRGQEGYGLTVETVRRLADEGCELLVTTDCGVSDVEEIRAARELGMRVVVVDHHSVPDELPPANAILNPLQPGCDFPFDKLAAVGVTFNLVVALRKELRERGVFRHVEEPDLRDMLDLVALGTIADVVPLVDENRIFVRAGLDVLAQKKRAGVSALMDRIGRKDGRIHTETVSYGLAPRLNAAGRVSDASICVELLTTREYRRAIELAGELEELNEERRRREREIYEIALPLAEEQIERFDHMLLLAGEGWDRGVLGIVASRFMEKFNRPTIVAGIESGEARGSARSIAGVDILAALEHASDFLSAYGGHTSAAGLRFDADDVEALRKRLDEATAQMLGSDRLPPPQIDIDAEVLLGDLEQDFVSDLLQMEPFGEGNPEPILLAQNVRARRAKIVGDDHLRASFADRTGQLDGIAFSMGEFLNMLENDVRVAFAPRFSRFR